MSTPQKRREAGAGHAEPLNQAPGKAHSEYTKSETPSTLRFPQERVSRRGFASIRLREIYTLALYRRRQNFGVDGITFVSVLAFTLACDEPGALFARSRTGDHGKQKRVPWMGLSLETLRRAIVSAELGHFEDDELATVIASVSAWRGKNGTRLHTAPELGRLLQLTRIERDACNVGTIEAVDEPKAMRDLRKTEEKRERDQTYNRIQRGRRPKAFREAEAETRRRLCEEHGITDRTLRRWERAGKVDVRLATSTNIDSCRTSRTGHLAVDDAGPSGRPSENRSEAKKNSVPEEPPSMPDATAVTTAIRQAEAILKAQRGRLRGKARDRLDEALSLLPGVRMILEWDADLPEHVAACSEGAVVYLRHFANDNTVAGIIRRLAA